MDVYLTHEHTHSGGCFQKKMVEKVLRDAVIEGQKKGGEKQQGENSNHTGLNISTFSAET